MSRWELGRRRGAAPHPHVSAGGRCAGAAYRTQPNSGYSPRYNKRSNQVVYWVRILESWHPALHHYLYWTLKTGLAQRLLDRLEDTLAGLGECVFAGLNKKLLCGSDLGSSTSSTCSVPDDWCRASGKARTPIQLGVRSHDHSTGWASLPKPLFLGPGFSLHSRCMVPLGADGVAPLYYRKSWSCRR